MPPRIDDQRVNRRKVATRSGLDNIAVFILGRKWWPSLFEFSQRYGVFLRKRCNFNAAQFRNMAVAAEVPAHIARERAHIGTLGAFDLEFGAVGIRSANDFQAVNLDFAGWNLDCLAFARKIVSPLAINLDGGELRRTWEMTPV